MDPSQLFTAIRRPSTAIRYIQSLLGEYYRSGVMAGTSQWPIGMNIFEKEWDVLIILDACRVDALRIVSEEFSFLSDPRRTFSVGGATPEWIANTFRPDYQEQVENTAYLSANPHAQYVLEDRVPPDDYLKNWGKYDYLYPNDFGSIEHIWKYERKGEESKIGPVEGHTPPRYVTDRGIDTVRRDKFARVILHYMPPHRPYIAEATSENRELKLHEKKPWKYIHETGDKKTVWESYLRELRFVLEDVEILLNNIDSDNVIITSDHGECFGKHGVYGHYRGSLHPNIRFVPWVETSANNTGDYSPNFDPIVKSKPIDERLEALGYK